MQYKTYQEAKIANPDCEIYYSAARRLGDKGFFSTKENARGFHHKCKPKDHCISLESFLASGKKLVRGDAYIGTSDLFTIVGDGITKSEANIPCSSDSDRYVLKAKALEDSAHEWANGDECRYINDPSHEYVYIGAHPHGDGHFVFSERKGIAYIANGCIIEPETQNEKAKREALDLLNPDGYGMASSMVESIVDKLSNAGMLKSKDETKYVRG